MRPVFADAQYWVAILNDQDQSHAAARAISLRLRGVTIVTTEEVITEVLTDDDHFTQEGFTILL